MFNRKDGIHKASNKIINFGEDCFDPNSPSVAAASEGRKPDFGLKMPESRGRDCVISMPETALFLVERMTDRLNLNYTPPACLHDCYKGVCPCPNRQQVYVCKTCFSVFCDQNCLENEAAFTSSATQGHGSQVSSDAPAPNQSEARALSPEANSAEPIQTKVSPALDRSPSHLNWSRNSFDSPEASFHVENVIGTALSTGEATGENYRVPITSCYPTIETPVSRAQARRAQALSPQTFGFAQTPSRSFSKTGEPPSEVPAAKPTSETHRSLADPEKPMEGEELSLPTPIEHTVADQNMNDATLNPVQYRVPTRAAAYRTRPLKLGVKHSVVCCWAGGPWDLGFNVLDELTLVRTVSQILTGMSRRFLYDPQVGDLCVVPSASFGFGPNDPRFRGKIVHNSSASLEVVVLYIDTGNVSEVSKRELCVMPWELRRLPALARRVKLANVEPREGNMWTLQAKMQLYSLIMDSLCEMVLLHQSDDVFYGTVAYMGKDVGVSLVENGVARMRSAKIPKLLSGQVASTSRDLASASSSSLPVQRVEAVQNPKPVLSGRPSDTSSYICPALTADGEVHYAERPAILPPEKERYQIALSYVTDLNSFYVVRQEDLGMRQRLNKNLALEAEYDLDTYNPAIHRSPIVIVNSPQYKWVRGIVCDMGRGHCMVRLLDYGDLLEVPEAEVKVPTHYAFRCPPYAFHCGMNVLPSKMEVKGKFLNEDGWDEKIIKLLKKIGNEPGLTALSIQFKKDKNIISLWPEGATAAWCTGLVENGLAIWLNPWERLSESGGKTTVVKGEPRRPRRNRT